MKMKIPTKNIVLCGLLTAVATILGGPLSARIFLLGGLNMRMSFAVVPCIFAGLTMGPAYGFVVGFLTDAATKLFFPSEGAYMPLFSVFMGCMGMVPSLLAPLFSKFFRKPKGHYLSLLPAILISQIMFSTIANTWLISALSGGGIFWAMLPTRAITLILVPVHSLFVSLLVKIYARVTPPAI